MFCQRLVIAVLVLCVSVSALVGQTPVAPTEPAASATQETQNADEKKQQLEAQAVALLRAMSEEAGQMRLAENRAFFLTSVADLLWDEDEKTARDLYRYAMADVRAVLARGSGEDESPSRYGRRMESGNLRQTLLMSLAAHDPKTARAFLRETHDLATAGGNESYGPYGNDEQLELNLAVEIARNDPAQALEIGRQTLAKGFSQQLLSLAQAIYKKDPETANKFAGEIIAKLKNTNLNEDPNASSYAISLFQAGVVPEGRAADPNKKATPLLDDAQMRELADLIAQAALSSMGDESNPGAGAVSGLLSELEKYAPARVRQIRAKMGPEAVSSNEAQNAWKEVMRLREQGTVDEILQAAAKPENAPMSAMYYDAAVNKLIAAGEIDRARSLVAEKITEPENKRRLSETIEQGALTKAATSGNLEESRRLLSTVRTDEERIMTLAQLAMAVGAKDKKTALGLLQEASSMLTPRSRNYRQLLARMALVNAYASIGSDRAFDILESSVEQSNEVLAAFFVVGEFVMEDEVVRDDEVTVFQLGRLIGNDLQQYRKMVALMALSDFKRMRGVADRFQRQEVRLLAQLFIADSLLGKAEEPASTNALPAGVPSVD